MIIIRKNILSLFTGVIILSLLFNPVKGILDIPHQSCLFTSISLSTLIGISTFFSSNRLIQRPTVIDWLFILIAIGSIYFYPPHSSLYGLARFALVIIYWGIRQTGGLNATILYYVILAAIIILSAIGYLQVFHVFPSYHPDFEITGPYGNPTIYAGMLALLLTVPTITLLHFKKSIIPAHLYFMSIFIYAMALPALWLTNCRSAWIAILAIIGYAIHHRFSCSVRWGLFTLLLIGLLSFWLYQLKPASANGRVLIWKVTTQMVKEKPFSGFGPHGFNTYYMHFQGDYLQEKGTIGDKRLADNNHYVYNEPLRWTVEYGIPGLLLYIGILYIIFSYKEREIRSLSAKTICIAGLVWGFFSYPDQAFPILVIMVIALAEMSNQQKKSIVKQFSYKSIFLKTLLLFAIVGEGVLLKRMYRNQHELHQISQYSINRPSEEIISDLSHLESAMKNETIFWIYYCHTLDKCQKDTTLLEKIINWERLYPSTHTYILKGDALQRTGKLKDAEVAYWTAHKMVPSRQKARYKLALLYYRQGRIPEAVELANEILTEKVKIYDFETYEMHRELRRIFENQLK